jgi:hypothetical protein
MIPSSGRCHIHPDRAGLGVCVECKQVICRECTTQFEGINRCARCLAKKLQGHKALGDRREWTALNVALALGSFGAIACVVRLVAWLVER